MSTTVIVGPAPLKLFAKLLLGFLAMLAGVAALFGLSATSVSILAGICGLLFVGVLVAGRPRVEIGPAGFVAATLTSSRTRRWGDVDGNFVVFRSGLNYMVGYRLTEACKQSIGFKPTTLFDGNDEAISGIFRLSIAELSALLNEYKERAANAATP
jgi:hypothetical protein